MCGIAAVALKKPDSYHSNGGALYYLHLMLNELQHRGQETAGFFTFSAKNGKTLEGKKSIGKVNNLFLADNFNENKRLLEEYSGIRATGHVRYATSGSSKTEKELLNEAQPFYFRSGNPNRRFVLQWNGNLANFDYLKKYLNEEYNIYPETNVDTEILMYLISNDIEENYKRHEEIKYREVFSRLHENIDGGLSMILMNGLGDIIAYRGRPGIMPLCYGENDDLFAVASETCALSKIGIKNYTSFKPGEIVIYKDSTESYLINESNGMNACFFQWVYFARITSILDNLGVNSLREKLGEKLAEIEPLRNVIDNSYVIVPVPDTSIPAARSMAKELQISYEEVVIKNSQAGRTFIEKNDKRDVLMKTKYSFIPGKTENKKIILVEDSIVRGNTIGALARNIKEELNPLEIHIRSTCPPIISPCYYGTDYPTFLELIAHNYPNTVELENYLTEKFNVDSVMYMPLEKLIDVFNTLGFPDKRLCIACLTGSYPTKEGNRRSRELPQR